MEGLWMTRACGRGTEAEASQSAVAFADLSGWERFHHGEHSTIADISSFAAATLKREARQLERRSTSAQSCQPFTHVHLEGGTFGLAIACVL